MRSETVNPILDETMIKKGRFPKHWRREILNAIFYEIDLEIVKRYEILLPLVCSQIQSLFLVKSWNHDHKQRKVL